MFYKKRGISMKSIKNKLIISTFASIFICVMIATAVSWRYTKNVVERDFVKGAEAEVEKIDDGVALFFEEMSNNLYMLSENSTVRQADDSISKYTDGEGTVTLNPAGAEGVESDIYRVYEEFARGRSNIPDIFMGTEQGGYIQYASGEMSYGYDPRERPWYQLAKESPGEVVKTGAYYWETADSVNISLAKTITNPAGAVIGVQAIDIGLDNLTEMVEDIAIGQEGYIILAEADGTILSNPRKPETNFSNISDLGVSGIGNGTFEFSNDGDEYLGINYSSDKTGWQFISVVPMSELSQRVNVFSMIVIVLGFVSIVAALVTITIVSSRVIKPIRGITEFIGQVEEGNFTETVEVAGNDEVARLSNSLNNMIENVRELLAGSKSVSEDVSETSSTLAFMANQIDQTADEMVEAISEVSSELSNQGRDTEEIISTIEDFTSRIEEVSEHISNKAKEVSQMTDKGLDVVGKLDKTTQETKKSSNSLAETTAILSEKSKSIGEIIEMIDSVTEQTGLLALNASIEAARAGEAGRGFAVVATEISKLAEESRNSTREIEEIVLEIQNEIDNSVESIGKSNTLVESSVEIVDETKNIFEDMVRITSEMQDEASVIDTVVEGMSVEKEEIAEKLNTSAQASEQTAALSEELTASTEEQSASIHTMVQGINKLEELSQKLMSNINKFDV